jgi:hypothetical protein
VSDQCLRFDLVEPNRGSQEIYLIRVEDHRTSQEPNGRTREEGSASRGTPAVAPSELRRGVSRFAPKCWSRVAAWLDLSHAPRGTPNQEARFASLCLVPGRSA